MNEYDRIPMTKKEKEEPEELPLEKFHPSSDPREKSLNTGKGDADIIQQTTHSGARIDTTQRSASALTNKEKQTHMEEFPSKPSNPHRFQSERNDTRNSSTRETARSRSGQSGKELRRMTQNEKDNKDQLPFKVFPLSSPPQPEGEDIEKSGKLPPMPSSLHKARRDRRRQRENNEGRNFSQEGGASRSDRRNENDLDSSKQERTSTGPRRNEKDKRRQQKKKDKEDPEELPPVPFPPSLAPLADQRSDNKASDRHIARQASAGALDSLKHKKTKTSRGNEKGERRHSKKNKKEEPEEMPPVEFPSSSPPPTDKWLDNGKTSDLLSGKGSLELFTRTNLDTVHQRFRHSGVMIESLMTSKREKSFSQALCTYTAMLKANVAPESPLLCFRLSLNLKEQHMIFILLMLRESTKKMMTERFHYWLLPRESIVPILNKVAVDFGLQLVLW